MIDILMSLLAMTGGHGGGGHAGGLLGAFKSLNVASLIQSLGRGAGGGGGANTSSMSSTLQHGTTHAGVVNMTATAVNLLAHSSATTSSTAGTPGQYSAFSKYLTPTPAPVNPVNPVNPQPAQNQSAVSPVMAAFLKGFKTGGDALANGFKALTTAAKPVVTFFKTLTGNALAPLAKMAAPILTMIPAIAEAVGAFLGISAVIGEFVADILSFGAMLILLPAQIMSAWVSMIFALKSFSGLIVESNRGLAMWNGTMAAAFLQLDLLKTHLDIQQAKATAGSAAAANDQFGELLQELQPLRNSVGTIMNILSVFASNTAIFMVEVVKGIPLLGGLLAAANDYLKKIEDALKPKFDANDPMVAFLGALKNMPNNQRGALPPPVGPRAPLPPIIGGRKRRVP